MPECYADTLLIQTLVPTKEGYNHKHNCFKVESGVKGINGFAVGIIDKDKKMIKYLGDFDVIDKVEGSLILWKHPQKPHYFIQLCPALEKLVLKICLTEKIDIGKYGFGNDINAFKSYTKSRTSIFDKNLIGLFQELSDKNECLEIRKLKGWVKMLKEKNYQVDINDLKNV